jgi:hypothetical protein
VISGKLFTLKTFQLRIQKSVSENNFLSTFNVYHMADKDEFESDLVMVSNESETYSNPKKRQETFLSFFTNPIVKKSKHNLSMSKYQDFKFPEYL